mmetsp:Transcript_19676/g.31283  ORF Transcript_19676/g.31283 Transcript_19676/m.31283 type:complete len:218 (+) Transcript_19676:143-796(+)
MKIQIFVIRCKKRKIKETTNTTILSPKILNAVNLNLRFFDNFSRDKIRCYIVAFIALNLNNHSLHFVTHQCSSSTPFFLHSFHHFLKRDSVWQPNNGCDSFATASLLIRNVHHLVLHFAHHIHRVTAHIRVSHFLWLLLRLSRFTCRACHGQFIRIRGNKNILRASNDTASHKRPLLLLVLSTNAYRVADARTNRCLQHHQNTISTIQFTLLCSSRR